MTIEHNDIFIISIYLHVLTSRGHHQANVRTFLNSIHKFLLLEMIYVFFLMML